MGHISVFRNDHHWFAVAEQALLRAISLGTGVILIVLGIGLGFTMVMLPIGAFMALIGAGLVATAVTPRDAAA
jgi:hypothetical protein